MLLLLVYALLALVFSFLCSIAEAVLLSLTATYVTALQQAGRRSGTVLHRLKDDIDRPLAAILSLNTVAHTVGAVGVGAQAAAVFGSGYVGAVSAILTLLILVLSEIIPKTLGATHWRALAPAVGTGVTWLIRVLYPLVWLSELVTKWLSATKGNKAFTRDELAALADLGVREGRLAVSESRILHNLLGLRSLTVKDIMTPRTVVFSLPEKLTMGQLLAQYPELSFSRIPVYGESSDDTTGFVLKSDLLLAQARDQHQKCLGDFRRELPAVPAELRLVRLFEFMLGKRAHVALAVDEYGAMQGIVTLEDLLETLLGLEIVDEADRHVDMQALARAQWQKRARRMGLNTESEERKDSPRGDPAQK